MKIAILGLPFDNNYGGNLQRYALVKTLQNMGHEVECVFLRRRYSLPWYKKPYSYGKRIIKKIFNLNPIPIFFEEECEIISQRLESHALDFYNRYIPHTEPITKIEDLKRMVKDQYDAVVVGSDQVWRKEMTTLIGLKNYFLDFLGLSNVKRIAYAVSIGTSKPLDVSIVNSLKSLYYRFDGVSVREDSAIGLFKNYGWTNPSPVLVLDPSMLLDVEQYKSLIDSSIDTVPSCENYLFCYVLDMNDNVKRIIKERQASLGLNVVIVNLSNTHEVSIEGWLKYIIEANFVITDSYHGTVFSILFHKPFIFTGNENRGNIRISTLLSMLDIEETTSPNWELVEKRLAEWRKTSMSFLYNHL